VTVRELRDLLDGWLTRHPREGDRAVVIETANGGIPHRYMSPVVTATAGFDWTASLFVIRTSDALVVEKVADRPLSVLAEERLTQLQEAHEKLGFEYIKRRRAAEWMAGFIEGVRSRITTATEGGDQ
jgi:hypothetical protein